MKKPIFLRVSPTTKGTTAIVCIDGQVVTSKSTGNTHKLATDYQVVLRDTTAKFDQGVILATNEITPKDSYYIAGSVLQVLTDAKGVPVKNPTADVAESIKAYEAFKNGESLEEAEKPKRKTLLDILKSQPEVKPPTIEDDGFYVDTDTWYFLLRNLTQRKNMLLLGDTGVGKTDVVMLLHKKLGKRLEIFDMAITNPVTALCGNQRINERGHSEFQLARFAKMIQTDCSCLLDELSRAHPSANNVLLPVTDKRRTLYIENAMENPEIKVHKDVAFWATANIGMEYVGTSDLDDALLNRFLPFELTYPPKDKEANVLVKRCGLEQRIADKLVNFANTVRSSEQLSKKVSTRQLLEIGELIYDGYNLSKAIEAVVLHQYPGKVSDIGGEKSTILSIIQTF